MPESFVTKVFVTPVLTFVTVIVTPGTSAPEGSVTLPRMSREFVLCAKHVPLPTIRRTGRSHRCIFVMEVPPKLLRCESFNLFCGRQPSIHSNRQRKSFFYDSGAFNHAPIIVVNHGFVADDFVLGIVGQTLRGHPGAGRYSAICFQ